MSLTAELFGGSITTSASKPLKNKDVGSAPVISFEPTKKATFDLFAVAPQVRKATRKEKQCLLLQSNSADTTKVSKKVLVHGDLAHNEILPTVFLGGDKVETINKQRTKTGRKKHLRHAIHKNEEEESRMVFVGNLKNDVKRRTVEKIFKSCGEIESVRVRAQAVEEGEEDGGKKSQQRRIGRAIRVLRGDLKKGDQYSAVAYVLFKDKSSLPEALEKNAMIVNNRHIVVTAMDPASCAYAPETSVFLGNIAYDTNEEAIWTFFTEKGVAGVKRVRLVRDRESGKCKGFGYVEFHTPASVPKAISLRGGLLNGREVRIVHVQKSKAVSQTKPNRREKRQRDMQETKKDHKADMRQIKRARKEEKVSERSEGNALVQPSWMGVTTNPRKKIPRDLRPLVEHKKSRPGPQRMAPVKRKMRNPEKGGF